MPTPHDVDAEQLWRTLEDLLLQVLEVAKIDDAAELSGLGCGCERPHVKWQQTRHAREGPFREKHK